MVQTIQTGNPHSDDSKRRHLGVVRGPSVGIGNKGTPTIVPRSWWINGERRSSHPVRRPTVRRSHSRFRNYSPQSGRLLSLSIRTSSNDRLVDFAGPLLSGVDLSRFARPVADVSKYGPISDRYGMGIDGSSIDPSSYQRSRWTDLEWRLPAAMVVGRELSGRGSTSNGEFRRGDSSGSIVDVATAKSPTWDVRLLAAICRNAGSNSFDGNAEFPRTVSAVHLLSNVVPTDEVVSLKMFHREDDPLARLFLDDTGRQRVDRLWEELRFVSRQASPRTTICRSFIGFVNPGSAQDNVSFFEGMRPAFQKRADEQLQREQSAIASHLSAVERFADRAFRRPLSPKEKADLSEQYRAIRSKGAFA